MAKCLFTNGYIRTMADSLALADWVLVEGERILDAGRGRFAQTVDTQIDLGGHTMVPGFIDPHGHFPESGLNAVCRLDVSTDRTADAASLGDVLDMILAAPPGEWVLAMNFDHTILKEGRFPTLTELDAVQPERPVWLMHASGHAGALNSAGMARMGVTGDGYLAGIETMGDMGSTDFGIDDDALTRGLAEATSEYAAQGVTLAHNAWLEQRLLDRIVALDQAGGLHMDLIGLPAAELEPALSAKLPTGLRRLILGPRKLFADGAFQVQTAFLSQPYHLPVNGDPTWRGMRYTQPQTLATDVLRLHQAGHQVHIHTNGDGASDDALDAIEAALQSTPRDDHRHTLIHGQALRDDQLDRMARLGVTVSFFSAHVYFWGEMHRDVFLGPERAARISPARAALDRGIRITLHNDAPVTPTRPLNLMWNAVVRETAKGAILGPEQRITPEEALRAHTIDAAWQVFQDHDRGSIEPGKRADFAILSDDPLSTTKPLKDITVEETIAAGKTIFKRSQKSASL